MNIRNSHLAKAGPCWRLLLICESRIPCRSFGTQVLLEHCLERTPPTLAECRNPQRALQLLDGLSWQIQKCVNVGHTHSLGIPSRMSIGDFHNVIAGADFSLLQHAEIESRSVMRHEQRRHT